MKDYHINIIGDSITVTKDINRKGVGYMREDFHNCWKKQYILEVGDKVVDIFGNVVTIKEILKLAYAKYPTDDRMRTAFIEGIMLALSIGNRF